MTTVKFGCFLLIAAITLIFVDARDGRSWKRYYGTTPRSSTGSRSTGRPTGHHRPGWTTPSPTGHRTHYATRASPTSGHHQKWALRDLVVGALEEKDLNIEARTACPSDHFQCHSGICLRDYVVCNGHDECGDGSDELNCQNDNAVCPNGRVPCSKTGVCVELDWFCDGTNDCLDWSDEEECAGNRVSRNEQVRRDQLFDFFRVGRRLNKD